MGFYEDDFERTATCKTCGCQCQRTAIELRDAAMILDDGSIKGCYCPYRNDTTSFVWDDSV